MRRTTNSSTPTVLGTVVSIIASTNSLRSARTKNDSICFASFCLQQLRRSWEVALLISRAGTTDGAY